MCPEFLRKTPDERARAVGESGRCFVCLKPGHRSRYCTSDEKCNEDGCGGRHHCTLHGSGRVFSVSNGAKRNSAHRTVAVATPQENETTLLQIVPIRVHGERSFVDTFALLDSGAQVSLCTQDLAEKLELRGETRPLSLNNVEGSGPRRVAMKTSLKLTALAKDSDPATVTASEVWTVPRLNVPSTQISTSARAEWGHLKGLDLALAQPGEVQVLLGANVLEGVLQREVRVGRPGQPVAVKSHFGWALCGKISGLVSTAEQHVMHVHRTQARDSELHEFVRSWWDTETFGTTHNETKPTSHEDRRAVKMLQSSTRLADGHFESPLLWKTDDVAMPDNRLGALHRLERAEQALRKKKQGRQQTIRKLSITTSLTGTPAFYLTSKQPRQMRNAGCYPITLYQIPTSPEKCEWCLTQPPSSREHVSTNNCSQARTFCKSFPGFSFVSVKNQSLSLETLNRCFFRSTSSLRIDPL